MDKFTVQTFNLRGIQGLSEKQLEEHFKLYKGYVERMNEIRKALSIGTFEDPNTTYGPLRDLKLGETYALNGIKLHEFYFGNLGGKRREPFGEIKNQILKDFGTIQNYLKNLKNVGLAARGWAVTALDPMDMKLHTFLADEHNHGAIWHAYPILVLDVYEHAYFYDFQTDRKKYIDVFIQNINWEVVNARFVKVLSILHKNCK